MTPDASVVRGPLPGEGNHPRNVPKGTKCAVYVRGPGLSTLTLDLSAGRYQVRWVNTATGRTEVERVLDHPGSRPPCPCRRMRKTSHWAFAACRSDYLGPRPDEIIYVWIGMCMFGRPTHSRCIGCHTNAKFQDERLFRNAIFNACLSFRFCRRDFQCVHVGHWSPRCFRAHSMIHGYDRPPGGSSPFVAGFAITVTVAEDPPETVWVGASVTTHAAHPWAVERRTSGHPPHRSRRTTTGESSLFHAKLAPSTALPDGSQGVLGLHAGLGKVLP